MTDKDQRNLASRSVSPLSSKLSQTCATCCGEKLSDGIDGGVVGILAGGVVDSLFVLLALLVFELFEHVDDDDEEDDDDVDDDGDEFDWDWDWAAAAAAAAATAAARGGNNPYTFILNLFY